MADEDPYLVGARSWLAKGGGMDPGPDPAAAAPLDVPTKDDLRFAQLARDLADVQREVEEIAAVHDRLRRGVIYGDIAQWLVMLAIAVMVVLGG